MLVHIYFGIRKGAFLLHLTGGMAYERSKLELQALPIHAAYLALRQAESRHGSPICGATQTHEGNMGWKTVSPSSVGGTNYSGFIRNCKTRRHKAISRSIYRMREEKRKERACSSHCLAAFVSG